MTDRKAQQDAQIDALGDQIVAFLRGGEQSLVVRAYALLDLAADHFAALRVKLNNQPGAENISKMDEVVTTCRLVRRIRATELELQALGESKQSAPGAQE